MATPRRSKQEHQRINNVLGAMGLGQLEDPGICAQLGFLVQDHAHLRELLNVCEPALRRDMYEALRPHLRFEAKPLDVYIAELGQDAEVKQLPTIAEDGSLRPFKLAPEIHSEPKTGELKVAQEAIAGAAANVFLDLVCSQCTRAARFPGGTQPDAVALAGKNGWGINPRTKKKYCPQCFGEQLSR